MATQTRSAHPRAPDVQGAGGEELSTRTNILLIVGGLVQVVAYIIGFRYALMDRYGGEGYLPTEQGVSLPIILALSAFCSFLCSSRNPFLTFALQFINWFIMIPMLTIAYYGAGSVPMLAYSLVGFAIISLLARASISLPVQSIGTEQAFSNGLLVVAASVVVLTVLFGGLENFNLDFSRVYDYRSSASDSLPAIFEYIRPITVATIIPLGVALALWRKNILYLFFYMMISVALFALSAHKSIFFVPIFVLSAFFSMRSGGKWLWLWPAFMSFIAIIASIEVFLYYRGILNSDWITSLFFRRTLMTPSMLNYIFYDVFSEYPKYYWSDSRVTLGLLDSPYIVTAPSLVGVVRFSDVELAANTGWLGSGFAQAGAFGIGLYSAVIGCFIALMRAAAERAGRSLVAAASVMQLSAMTRDADLLTTLLTHGLALFLVLILFLPSRHAAATSRG